MARRARIRNLAVLTREECAALAQRIVGLVAKPRAQVVVNSTALASTSFVRGDAHVMAEDGGVEATIMLRDGEVTTTRLDDAGLKAAIAALGAASKVLPTQEQPESLMGPQHYATPPKLFYESVEAAMASGPRAEIFRQALDATEAAGLIGAGDLRLSAYASLIMNTAGLFAFSRATFGEFSLTARTKDGTGSGWAWSGYEDWSRVKPEAVIARAVNLAERSAKPVAVEPGRYTVILEPAAVAELLIMPAAHLLASTADRGGTVFSKEPRGTNKIGLKMLDERLSIVLDPWDPEMPMSTISMTLEPARKFVLFERGVLRDLMYTAAYARQKNREPSMGPGGLRLFAEGPTQTLEEMIASTKRGIWVNRLSNVRIINYPTLLKTGTTRDGTFLIENGKITKAIKNFRFNESPFFVFNRVEAAGEPVRASQGVVAPRVKVRDFDFTSLTDAI